MFCTRLNPFGTNLPDMQLAYGAKAMRSDMAVRVANDALQLHGGYGYAKEALVEKLYRDAKVTYIYEDPNQVLAIATSKKLHMGV